MTYNRVLVPTTWWNNIKQQLSSSKHQSSIANYEESIVQLSLNWEEDLKPLILRLKQEGFSFQEAKAQHLMQLLTSSVDYLNLQPNLELSLIDVPVEELSNFIKSITTDYSLTSFDTSNQEDESNQELNSFDRNSKDNNQEALSIFLANQEAKTKFAYAHSLPSLKFGKISTLLRFLVKAIFFPIKWLYTQRVQKTSLKLEQHLTVQAPLSNLKLTNGDHNLVLTFIRNFLLFTSEDIECLYNTSDPKDTKVAKAELALKTYPIFTTYVNQQALTVYKISEPVYNFAELCTEEEIFNIEAFYYLGKTIAYYHRQGISIKELSLSSVFYLSAPQKVLITFPHPPLCYQTSGKWQEDDFKSLLLKFNSFNRATYGYFSISAWQALLQGYKEH